MKKVQQALQNYMGSLIRLKAQVEALQSVGLTTYSTNDIEQAVQRAYKFYHSPNLNLARLVHEIEEGELGLFSWDGAIENAKGTAVRSFGAVEADLDKLTTAIEKAWKEWEEQ